MATQEQLNTVRKLHEQNDRTLGGYDQTKGQYNISSGDPYEAYYAKEAGGLLTPDATVDIVAISAGLPDYSVSSFNTGVSFGSTVTFNNALGGEDEGVTWSLGAITGTGTFDISNTGVVTSIDTIEGDTVTIVAVSNFDGATTGSLLVNIVA